MVFVNSKKYACESCIKGHRSSSCHHTDRPLFEIKKKGRPVSQCETCRQLRQSKKVHSKCSCSTDRVPISKGIPQPSAPGTKPKRYIPTVPTLPNGLKDLKSSPVLTPADTRQRVETLLNPCTCQEAFGCVCRAQDRPATEGLSALANAAALCCSSEPCASGPLKRGTTPPSGSPHKRNRSGIGTTTLVPGPELPPLLFSDEQYLLSPSSPMVPAFDTIPPMSTIVSIAGTGCTCGVKCACPGCVEHRGPELASKTHHDCIDTACSHCVDHQQGIALPTPDPPNRTNNTILDRFFAQAAALPPPPTFTPGVPHQPVNLPKLECCGGTCGCPDGVCGCGENCGGCCEKHQQQEEVEVAEIEALGDPPPKVLGSCCSGRS